MNREFCEVLPSLIDGIIGSYEKNPVSNRDCNIELPDKAEIIEIIRMLQDLLFPGYFGAREQNCSTLVYYVGELILRIEKKLKKQIKLALLHKYYTESNSGENYYNTNLDRETNKIVIEFFKAFPLIREYTATDVQAAFDGDPAAGDKDIIIFAYPGIYAISIYRFANVFYKLNVPLIPRIMSEYAHNKTGIDIHPGANIGKYFFIDHGTGVVIGETTTIGENVKIYQGVTLGALSTRGGQSMKGMKRHPTIEDNVTIYSGVSILGGETVIGKDSVIGGNAFITKSVPPGNKVSIKNPELNFYESKKSGGNNEANK